MPARPKLGRRWRRWAGLGLVGLAAAAALAAFGPGAWRAWSLRPPSAACRARAFDVTLAGLALRLPASPLVRADTGNGDGGGIYPFADGLRLRDFCDRTAGRRGVKITALLLKLGQDAPCPPADSDRIGAVVCPDAAGASARWTAAAVYSPTEYDHLALGSSIGAYASFRRERALTEVNEAPMAPVRIGAFDRYPDGFWVAKAWMTASGEPVALSCGPSKTVPGWLDCTTTHAVGAGLQATLGFRTPPDELEATARRIEADLTLVLAVLAPGQGLGVTPPPAAAPTAG
jgi:hypothetical protein